MDFKKTQFELLSPIQKTRYNNLKEPFLFYDISELGWSRYISAHVNYLTKNGKKVAVCCSDSRRVLYQGFATEILPIPESYYKEFGHLLSASHHLHDADKNIDIMDDDIISKPFKEAYPDYNVITGYSKFYNERIFEPYKHSKEIEYYCQRFRECIIVFPRFRNSRFARRNISKENWVKVIERLCKDYPNYDIITMGGKEGTLSIDLPFKNYYNLVENKDNLEIIVALCNMKKVITCFGTQSGITHIATLCKASTYIIGHDPYDMGIHAENFTNADIKFWQTIETENGYNMDNIDKLIEDFINFIGLLKIKNMTL